MADAISAADRRSDWRRRRPRRPRRPLAQKNPECWLDSFPLLPCVNSMGRAATSTMAIAGVRLRASHDNMKPDQNSRSAPRLFRPRGFALWVRDLKETPHAKTKTRPHRSHHRPAGLRRQRLRLDGRQEDHVRAARPFLRGGAERSRYGRCLFRLGAGQQGRRVRDDSRGMDEGAGQAFADDRRHQGRLADGPGQEGP